MALKSCSPNVWQTSLVKKCNPKTPLETLPIEKLEDAISEGKPTASRIKDTESYAPEDSYMAASHVWADGTDVGGERVAC